MATGHTRRGPEAVDAAIEEFEIRSRVDELDSSIARPADADLRWARSRIDAARRAAEADVISAGEALEWLAGEVGREVPDDYLEDERPD